MTLGFIVDQRRVNVLRAFIASHISDDSSLTTQFKVDEHIHQIFATCLRKKTAIRALLPTWGKQLQPLLSVPRTIAPQRSISIGYSGHASVSHALWRPNRTRCGYNANASYGIVVRPCLHSLLSTSSASIVKASVDRRNQLVMSKLKPRTSTLLSAQNKHAEVLDRSNEVVVDMHVELVRHRLEQAVQAEILADLFNRKRTIENDN